MRLELECVEFGAAGGDGGGAGLSVLAAFSEAILSATDSPWESPFIKPKGNELLRAAPTGGGGGGGVDAAVFVF